MKRTIDTATEELPEEIRNAVVQTVTSELMEALQKAVVAPEPVLRGLVQTFSLAAKERKEDPKLSKDPLTEFIACTAGLLKLSLDEGGNPTVMEVSLPDPEETYGVYL